MEKSSRNLLVRLVLNNQRLPHRGQGPMEKLNECIKAAKAEGKNWRNELYKHYYAITAQLPRQQLTLPQRHYSSCTHRLVPSRYLSGFWDERRLGIRLRRTQGLMGREEGKIALYPFHETPRAPQPNPKSSLIPKST